MPVNSKIATSVRSLVRDIEIGRFSTIATDGRIGRLTIDELENAIVDYPGVISSAPEKAFVNFYTCRVTVAVIETWAIDFDLWYNGKESDLTLSATLEMNGDGNYNIQIDNIHTL